MTDAELVQEVKELKRRIDLAETRLGQVEGRFEFVSGQLRDIQLYMHAKFADVDKRLDKVETRLGAVETKLDGLIETLPGMMRDVMREVLAEKRSNP